MTVEKVSETGILLSKHLESCSLSVKKLAEAVASDHATLLQILSGEKEFSPDLLEKVILALNLSGTDADELRRAVCLESSAMPCDGVFDTDPFCTPGIDFQEISPGIRNMGGIVFPGEDDAEDGVGSGERRTERSFRWRYYPLIRLGDLKKYQKDVPVSVFVAGYSMGNIAWGDRGGTDVIVVYGSCQDVNIELPGCVFLVLDAGENAAEREAELHLDSLGRLSVWEKVGKKRKPVPYSGKLLPKSIPVWSFPILDMNIKPMFFSEGGL